jgi:hypothetical protein
MGASLGEIEASLRTMVDGFDTFGGKSLSSRKVLPPFILPQAIARNAEFRRSA